jgi:hypothetical protein
MRPCARRASCCKRTPQVTELRPDDAWLATELAALAPVLDRTRAPAPPPALLERTLRMAAAELARTPALLPGVASFRPQLPVGFRRELARLLVTSLPALALGFAWAALLLWLAPAWLAHWLPAGVALALVGAQLVAVLSALGLVTASLPLFAHRRALLRMRGVES